MTTIKDISSSHAELDRKLSRLRRTVHELEVGRPMTRRIRQSLQGQLEELGVLLNRHIDNERSPQDVSAPVVGEGELDEWKAAPFHAKLKYAMDALLKSINVNGVGSSDGEEMDAAIALLSDLFEEYTAHEQKLLQQTAALLFPGGGQG